MKRMKRGVFIAIAVLACAVTGIGGLTVAGRGEGNGHTTIAVLSIDSIAEKLHNEDGYFLTVALEDWLIEDWGLSYDRITLKAEREIYDKVSAGDVYAGVTLRIREPEKCANGDVRAVLKRRQDELCEIISLGQRAE